MDVDTVHAFGFDARANYKWDEKNSTTFSVAQPLRIESGNMKVMGYQMSSSVLTMQNSLFIISCLSEACLKIVGRSQIMKECHL